MNSVTIFWLQLLVSCVVCVLVVAWYVWPYLTKLTRHSALIPLLFVHVFRYVGMVLLVPGMVDPKLPQGVLLGSAYGDLLAAALALASIIALRSNWPSAIPLVWVFNTLGFLDLLNVLRSVLQIDLPTYYLGSIWFIYTFYAPLVIVSHVMIFVILLNPRSWKNAEIAR
jgi:hypothetical protein